jgi:receptor protein-tyrosine kinase
MGDGRTMDTIERAAEILQRSADKSLVERAADRIGVQDQPPGSSSPEVIPEERSPQPDKAAEGHKQEAGPFVTLDFRRLRAKHVISPEGLRTQAAEEYRRIKRPLLWKALGQRDNPIKNGNVIMVTSAKPREGKTFTSINLAVSIAAEPGVTVVLIDADVTNPSISSMLDVELGRGLLDVIADNDLDLSDVLVRTNLPNLRILPSGTPRPLSTELLASDKMVHLIEEMARRYRDRIIVLDTAPVLTSSEAVVLAKHVGQIVFVIEAEETSKTVIDAAFDMIGHREHIGLVLNKTHSLLGSERLGAYSYYVRRR